ncbi:MAG: hypothetical protein SGPRY_014364, partial [Prymnesium sp.]
MSCLVRSSQYVVDTWRTDPWAISVLRTALTVRLEIQQPAASMLELSRTCTAAVASWLAKRSSSEWTRVSTCLTDLREVTVLDARLDTVYFNMSTILENSKQALASTDTIKQSWSQPATIARASLYWLSRVGSEREEITALRECMEKVRDRLHQVSQHLEWIASSSDELVVQVDNWLRDITSHSLGTVRQALDTLQTMTLDTFEKGLNFLSTVAEPTARRLDSILQHARTFVVALRDKELDNERNAIRDAIQKLVVPATDVLESHFGKWSSVAQNFLPFVKTILSGLEHGHEKDKATAAIKRVERLLNSSSFIDELKTDALKWVDDTFSADTLIEEATQSTFDFLDKYNLSREVGFLYREANKHVHNVIQASDSLAEGALDKISPPDIRALADELMPSWLDSGIKDLKIVVSAINESLHLADAFLIRSSQVREALRWFVLIDEGLEKIPIFSHIPSTRYVVDALVLPLQGILNLQIALLPGGYETCMKDLECEIELQKRLASLRVFLLQFESALSEGEALALDQYDLLTVLAVRPAQMLSNLRLFQNATDWLRYSDALHDISLSSLAGAARRTSGQVLSLIEGASQTSADLVAGIPTLLAATDELVDGRLEP